MNDEPTYEFVKGQGWVVTRYTSASKIYDGSRFTAIRRLPGPGERFFDCFPEETPEHIIKIAIQRWSNGLPVGGLYENYVDRFNYFETRKNVITILVEKI